GALAELRWAGEQPGDEVVRVHDGDRAIVGVALVDDRGGAEDGEHGDDPHGKADLLGQAPGDIPAIAERLLHVVSVRIVNAKDEVTHPNGCADVVLRVDREDSAWADDEVIDILGAGANRHRMPHKVGRDQSWSSTMHRHGSDPDLFAKKVTKLGWAVLFAACHFPWAARRPWPVQVNLGHVRTVNSRKRDTQINSILERHTVSDVHHVGETVDDLE